MEEAQDQDEQAVITCSGGFTLPPLSLLFPPAEEAGDGE